MKNGEILQGHPVIICYNGLFPPGSQAWPMTHPTALFYWESTLVLGTLYKRFNFTATL